MVRRFRILNNDDCEPHNNGIGENSIVVRFENGSNSFGYITFEMLRILVTAQLLDSTGERWLNMMEWLLRHAPEDRLKEMSESKKIYGFRNKWATFVRSDCRVWVSLLFYAVVTVI